MEKQTKYINATRFNLIVALIFFINGIMFWFYINPIGIFLLSFSGGIFGAEFWRTTWE
jgi:hypothetical protein